ncbi:MAG: ABC transporter ATP-binding protein [Gemmatimonadetes bacterium]|nr:ABC transporter ATP-binding protein [Gemmatimonadota bacterium]
MESQLVVAAGINKYFSSGVQALRDLNLEISRGQFVSIVGPSGCGKSTFLRLVAGLDEPTSGELRVEGHDPLGLAFVFQDATLLPWRSVAHNITLPLELRREDADERVSQTLELVGLTDFADAYPAQLSGGMRMRVSIARALVTRPQILLLDEPFGALDEITRQRLNEELLRLWQEDHWTSLFVTHNVSEAVFLSQRVLVMSARPGRILADIPIPFPYPRSPYLRSAPEFIRIANGISRQLAHADDS